jgi:hypothetical protein
LLSFSHVVLPGAAGFVASLTDFVTIEMLFDSKLLTAALTVAAAALLYQNFVLRGQLTQFTGAKAHGTVSPDVIRSLREALSADRVVTTAEVLSAHSEDHSPHSPGKAEVVVYPLNTEEVSSVVRICRDSGVIITACGQRTGLEG